ncbi:Type II secretion system (T2SS)-associated protein Gcp3 [Andalucia godoyi]|uniref:Peroxin-7 n=1 Tax=Andalucia godoyi TaxID=505711 RepID=A0A8K0AH56_ANDGO|nr:Type II secretion system (T2SS)-associated protein Gcp3 [Andalucia godoyi]|eukprot:ANDGO_04428.mRNA.1 Type II secretion system (T2SS)-associated protein Gcp3
MPVGICLASCPQSVKFSPFHKNIVGISCKSRPGYSPVSGMFYLLHVKPDDSDLDILLQGQINCGLGSFDWSHSNGNVFVAACDDAKLRFFDVQNEELLISQIDLKDRKYEHKEKFESTRIDLVEWDKVSTDHLLVSVMQTDLVVVNVMKHDEKVGRVIQNPHGTHSPITDASWNTHAPHQFQFCDLRGNVLGVDLRSFAASPSSTSSSSSSSSSRTTFDFRIAINTGAIRIARNPFLEYVVAVAGFDHGVRVFDLRMSGRGPFALYEQAHFGTVSSLKWSPHDESLLASGSHDRTLRLWDIRAGLQNRSVMTSSLPNRAYGIEPSLGKPQKVEDWVTGVDWSLHEPGMVGFVSHDHLFKAYHIDED